MNRQGAKHAKALPDKQSPPRRLLKKVQMQGGAQIPHSAMQRWPFSAACQARPPMVSAKSALAVWRRFSASSNTTDCGPSITSSVTSLPRSAGRQCM